MSLGLAEGCPSIVYFCIVKKSIINTTNTMSREEMTQIIRGWEQADEYPMPPDMAEFVGRIKPEVKTRLQEYFRDGGWHGVGGIRTDRLKEYNKISAMLSHYNSKNKDGRGKKDQYSISDVWTALGASTDLNNNPAVKEIKKNLLEAKKKNKGSFSGLSQSKPVWHANTFAYGNGFTCREFGDIIGIDFAQHRNTDDYIVELRAFANSEGAINPEDVPEETLQEIKEHVFKMKKGTLQDLLLENNLYLTGTQRVSGDPVEGLQDYLDDIFRPNGETATIDLSGLWREEHPHRNAYVKIQTVRRTTGDNINISTEEFILNRLKGYIYSGRESTTNLIPESELQVLLYRKEIMKEELPQYDYNRLFDGLSQQGALHGIPPREVYERLGFSIKGASSVKVGTRVKKSFERKEDK